MTLNPSPTEESPLLSETRRDPKKTTTTTGRGRWWTARLQVTSPRGIVLILASSLVTISTAGALVVVPTMRILEDILCHRFYGDARGGGDAGGEIDERLCKVDSVQSELALLNGLITTLEAAVGFAFAFPYGILADKIGRKPVFLLAMLGVTLTMIMNFSVLRFWRTIPVHLIIFTSLFEVIGGGSPVTLAVIYSIAADVELPADRASAFFLMALAALLGSLIGPPVSSRLMETSSPWVPLLMALALLPVGTSLIFFIPETLKAKADADEDVPEGQSSLSGLKTHLKNTVAQLLESFTMLRSRSLAIIIVTFVASYPLVIGKTQFFLQYFSKRFGWSLAQTGYLLSIRGLVSVFVLLVALPGLSKLLLSPRLPFRFPAAKKDLVLVQSSAALAMAGMLLLGTPATPTVFMGIGVATLGDGLAPLCRALLPAFIDPQHTSRIYTLVGMVEAIGTMFAGPALAYFFTLGMKLGGPWLGLPYFWLASICALVGVAFGFVDLATAVRKEPAEEEREEREERGERGEPVPDGDREAV
ncbi:uncharacterized protein L3040_002797 [Drepanopeziza brunnea f. sp. 'multigermtubi']|uniref:Major facilitator superfamily (MFS) profile domain-containing protein n=1 Tax=Marssonina brunnea f. sp. multigermtubi (strain MB_m1) TaxID=1072389 RepID=K1WLZ5_MARBU|nr:uncharacterized protein MBM_08425 [Drepanopeziza brunnea f. sp. 'multigermtubi' MB_m1]EKD13342.1 hypothetical protein MBM_08425 [Drepanopeziza brunnea f. sp. 'multigermtubi' MB_m1]KAJ5050930.1 hypothetical protein L3040_002797 [Drepanopeziza brunnea f. sp. 'multigermtubi']